MDLSKYLSPSKGPMQTLTKKPMKLPPRNAMVQLTDPDTGKARKMKPLGQAARRIYRKQILAGTRGRRRVQPRVEQRQGDAGLQRVGGQAALPLAVRRRRAFGV